MPKNIRNTLLFKENQYNQDTYTTLDAISEAQKIAFYPILFQAVMSMRTSGILAYLDKCGTSGTTFENLQENIKLSPYAIQLLLDMALSMHIIYQQDENYIIGKVGYFLLHNKMTQVNLNFTQDVCYQGMFHLQEALETGKPSGLSVFGDWKTIYPALSQLPEKAQKSWFEFDHFYSDNSFPAAFKYIEKSNPNHIYDVGGNTGKWAKYCVTHHENVHVTLLDLPQQLKLAQKNIEDAGLTSRISTYPIDILENGPLPQDADIWWMSQFLDCFNEEQIVQILTRIYNNMNENARVYIMDMFWDRQPFQAGVLSVNAISFYFTCLANGNSRFYHSKVFYKCLTEAGFLVEQDIDNLGIGHTLLICRKR